MKKAALLIVIFLVSISIFSQTESKTLYEQGIEAFKSANYGSSELIFRKIVDNEDEYRDRSWYFMALSIFYQKKYDDAIFEFNRFLLVCSTAELANKSRFWIAECYYGKKEYVTAIEEYRRFISKNKNLYKDFTGESFTKIGMCYYNQNRYDEAIIEYNNALEYVKKDSKIIELNYRIGESYFLNNKHSEAQVYLNKSFSSNDKYYSALSSLLLGRIMMEEKKYTRALNFFNNVPNDLKEKKQFQDIYYYSAICQNKTSDIKLAEENLRIYINLSKNNQLYYYALYELALIVKLKDHDEFEKLLENVYINSGNIILKEKSAIELALFYIENDKKDKALQYLNSINIKSENKNPQILVTLGDVYLKLGKYDKSEEIYLLLTERYKYDQNADKYQFYLALSYLKQGKTEKAENNFEKIKEINPFSDYINESTYYIGISEFENKKYSQSLNHLNKYVLQKNIKNEFDARKIILKIHIQLGNYNNVVNSANILIRKYQYTNDISEELFLARDFLKRNNKRYSYYEGILFKRYPNSKSTALVYKEKGIGYFNSKKYIYAENYFRKYLAIVGNDYDTDVFLKTGKAIYNQGKYEKVIFYFTNEKISVYNIDLFYKIFLITGKSYYQLKQYDKALEKFNAISDYDFEINDRYMYFKLLLGKNYVQKAESFMSYFEENNDIMASVLVDFGNYYLLLKEYEKAKEYYLIVISNKKYYKKHDESNYMLSLLLFNQSDYKSIITSNYNYKQISYKTKYNILLAESFIKTNKITEAETIIGKNIYRFIKYDEGEYLLISLINFYFSKNNLRKINYYSSFLLKNYKGNSNFVNFVKGNYFYNNKLYKKAYYHYYKIIRSENEYFSSANFKLGEISMYVYYNKRNAEKFFKNVKFDSEFYERSQIYLAQIYYEKGNKSESKNILLELLKEATSAKYKYQAQNLYEIYSF